VNTREYLNNNEGIHMFPPWRPLYSIPLYDESNSTTEYEKHEKETREKTKEE